MKKNIFIIMILMLFLNPLYSEEVSKIPQTQKVENNITKQKIGAVEEGIFQIIGKWIAKLLIAVIASVWDIIVGFFSYLFTASWLLPIAGVIIVLLIFGAG